MRSHNKRRAVAKHPIKPLSAVILCAVCGKADGKWVSFCTSRHDSLRNIILYPWQASFDVLDNTESRISPSYNIFHVFLFIFLLIRYKCPKCRAPFCCVQCSKDHKANHCPATTATTKSDVEKIDAAKTNVSSSTTAAAIEQSKYLPQKELLKNKRKRIRRPDHNDDEDSDDEPGWQITSEMKRRINNSSGYVPSYKMVDYVN